MSKFILSITDRKKRDKLFKGKDLDLPQVIEQTQQNTYDRKNKKNTIPEALISDRKNASKNHLYTKKHISQNTEQDRNDGNCRYCETPNWSPNH